MCVGHGSFKADIGGTTYNLLQQKAQWGPCADEPESDKG